MNKQIKRLRCESLCRTGKYDEGRGMWFMFRQPFVETSCCVQTQITAAKETEVYNNNITAIFMAIPVLTLTLTAIVFIAIYLLKSLVVQNNMVYHLMT